MAMSGAYHDLIATAGKNAITHISLVNGSDTEVTDREEVTWSGPSGGNGKIELASAIEFAVGAGATVAGYKLWSAVSGGTEYGAGSVTSEAFSGAGTYTLLAGGASYILHSAS